MNHFLRIAALLALVAFPAAANAVNCFWVGGTGTWDNSSITHWAPSTGGSATGCQTSNAAPSTGDLVNFDGASGGGTVTASATISGLSLGSITAGLFTGTLDFSVNNPSLTITSSMSLSGAGARKFLMGTGTYTFSGGVGLSTLDLGTITSLDALSTFNGATYVFNYAGSSTSNQNFNGGGKAWGAIVVSGARTGGSGLNVSNASTSFTSVTVTGPPSLLINNSMTISGALTITGSSAAPVYLSTGSNTLTVGSASIVWAGIRNSIFAGAAVSATSSLDLGGNNMNGGTISPPSGGSGGRIIGG